MGKGRRKKSGKRKKRDDHSAAGLSQKTLKKKLRGKRICWRCGTPYKKRARICKDCGVDLQTGETVVHERRKEIDPDETAGSWFAGVLTALLPGVVRPKTLAVSATMELVGFLVMMAWAPGLVEKDSAGLAVTAGVFGLIICALGLMWLAAGEVSIPLVELSVLGWGGWIVFLVLFMLPLFIGFMPLAREALERLPR